MVSSLALGASKRTISMVESFLPNMNCCTSAGSISVGMLGVDHIAEPEGLGDAGHGFYLLFHGDEFIGWQASTVIIPVEARWKSSSRATSPIMESRSCGR